MSFTELRFRRHAWAASLCLTQWNSVVHFNSTLHIIPNMHPQSWVTLRPLRPPLRALRLKKIERYELCNSVVHFNSTLHTIPNMHTQSWVTLRPLRPPLRALRLKKIKSCDLCNSVVDFNSRRNGKKVGFWVTFCSSGHLWRCLFWAQWLSSYIFNVIAKSCIT